MIAKDERRKDAIAILKARRGKLFVDWGELKHRAVMVEAKLKKVDDLIGLLERNEGDLDTILYEISSD